MKFQAYQPSLSVNRVSDWALQSSVTWQVTNDMLWILISHYMIGLANEHIYNGYYDEGARNKGVCFQAPKESNGSTRI